MTRDLSLIQDIKYIFPISIGLPNRALVIADKEGSIMLDKGIKLNKVLDVPSLKCNLMPIVKLCKELNYSVTFFDDFCVLQDHILRTLTGRGEKRRSLFFQGSVIGSKRSQCGQFYEFMAQMACETCYHVKLVIT